MKRLLTWLLFLLLPALLLYGRNKEQPDIAGDTKLLPSTA